MVQTRASLDLSKLSIHQVISNQTEEDKVTPSSMSTQNNNMDNSYNTNISCQSIETDSSMMKINLPLFTSTDATETKMIASAEPDNQMLISIPTSSQAQLTNHSIHNNEDKELARIPYYNGKTNIYAWLTAIKSVFIDLKYDESSWANKAKYYLLDHAAQFVYVNDEQMTNWKSFQKLMIDQYSSITTKQVLTDPLVNTLVSSCMTPQQYTSSSSDSLAMKAHHVLVLEDLKTLPRFTGEESQSISSWLEEIELVYDKAFITDNDKSYRTLKLLSNIDDKWLEFIRRQKLDWNDLKRKLISRFERKKEPSRIELEDAIRNRCYHDNEPMHHYYSDIMRQCDLLEEEYPVSDRHRIDYIIRGLPDSIQDQLLIREYSTPKELLEVLQKIEERRKRTNFEQHVTSIDENALLPIARATPMLQTTFLPTNNFQSNTPFVQQSKRYGNNTFHNNQLQQYRPPSRSSSNYNQQRTRQQRPIQCQESRSDGRALQSNKLKPPQHLQSSLKSKSNKCFTDKDCHSKLTDLKNSSLTTSTKMLASSCINLLVNNHLMKTMIDSGSDDSFISPEALAKISPQPIIHPTNKDFQAMNGTQVIISGYVILTIDFDKHLSDEIIYVSPQTNIDLLLGQTWIKKHQAILNCKDQCVTIMTDNGPRSIQYTSAYDDNSGDICQQYNIRLVHDVTIKSRTVQPVDAICPSISNADTVIFRPRQQLQEDLSILIPNSLLNIYHHRTTLYIVNHTDTDCVLSKNSKLGKIRNVPLTNLCCSITESFESFKPDAVIPNKILEDINILIQHLKPEHQQLIRPILLQEWKVFDISKPSQATDLQTKHRIITQDHPPIYQRPYRVPESIKQKQKELTDEMERNGQISRSQSPWASPVLLVKKHDGSPRFVVDYRKLNSITIRDCYPLPRMDDTINQLAGAQYYSKFDLKCGYHQVPIDLRDKQKTAFITS
ncbi:unnamed protein product, partial [Rotaria sordida]